MNKHEWEYSDEAREALEDVRARRGFTLPLHEVMAAVDPEILRRYNALSSYLIFGPEPRALDLKTRFLVMVGITTAVKGDREGVEWSSRRAMDNGATEQEVLEAMVLAGLPAGMPSVEGAATGFAEMLEGRGWVGQDADRVPSDSSGDTAAEGEEG